MEFKDEVRKLCDGMGVYHDCNIELNCAFGESNRSTIFAEMGNFLSCEENVTVVKDNIFYFILDHLDYLKDLHEDNFEYLIEHSKLVLDMTNAIFDTDYEKAIGIWDELERKVMGTDENE